MSSATILKTLALALSLSPLPALAQVNFNVVAIDQPLTISELQAAAQATTTAFVGGVEVGPGNDLFVIHNDGFGEETFLQIDPSSNVVSLRRTATQVAADLSAPYTSAFTPVGEFTWDRNRGAQGTLYFADNSVAGPPNFDEFALIAIDVATGTASEVLRSNTIAAWNSHGVLSDGQIVGTLGEDIEILVPGEEPQTGLVNPLAVTPSWELKFEEDDYKALIVPPLPLGAHLPPETIGVDPRNDDVYVFCHDELEIFRIDDITSVTPALSRIDIPGWTGVVDLHGLSVDEDGNVYGFDEAAEAIVVWNGAATFSVPFTDVETALGSAAPFGVTTWRGMKARKISPTQSEVVMASNSADYGVVRIVFGLDPGPLPADLDSDNDGFTDEYEKLVGSNAFLASVKPALGDVDTSGSITGADVAKIAQAVVGNSPASPYDAARADVDGNGVISVSDVTLLANFNAGLVATIR